MLRSTICTRRTTHLSRSFATPLHVRNSGHHATKTVKQDDVISLGPATDQPPLSVAAEVSHSQRPPAATQEGQKTADVRHEQLRAVQQKLQQWTAANAARLRERADTFSAAAAVGFQQLGGKLNRITGYEEIEVLKRRVVENEARITAARRAAREAKAAYDAAVLQRSASQREVNDLLQRKSSWMDADVGRFTQLVREDHLFEQNEARAKAAAADAEDAVERAFNELMRSILGRYHEEQVWSDKIRSASTYGSLAALALNLVVFLLAIVLVEPWKRRRLVQSFERRVVALNEENRAIIEAGLADLAAHMARQEEAVSVMAGAATDGTAAPRAQAFGQLDEVAPAVLASPPPADDARTLFLQRTAKAALDRDHLTLAAGGAAVAGVLGWVLGSWYG